MNVAVLAVGLKIKM